MNIDDIKYIINYCIINNLKKYDTIQKTIKNKNNRIIKEILENKYNLKFSCIELLYLIKNKNNLENLHIFCPTCGNKNIFHNLERGYGFHCSDKCVRSDKNVINKRTKSMINTKKYRYGTSSYVNIEKRKITTKKLYGVEHTLQRKDVREKINITNKNKTKEQKQQIIQTRQNTCQQKYNKKSYSQTDKFKNQLQNSLIKKFGHNYRQVIYKKSKETMLKKHGVTCAFQLSFVRNKLYSKETEQKRYATKKKNNTFNTSNPENKYYNLLLTKFPDTIHIYHDKIRYPFNCDIYIPSKDLFIEFHFAQYHQYHPFDKNSKINWIRRLILNLKNIKMIKQNKKKNQYERMIYTWTNLDVRKLEIANKNNLNWLCFYTEKEFLDWFNKQ